MLAFLNSFNDQIDRQGKWALNEAKPHAQKKF